VTIVESSSYQPRAAAPLALPRRTVDARATASWDVTGEVVLTTPRSTGRSPFLAQYLAQEFLPADDQSPRWRERDTAYRVAGDPPTTPRLSLDV